MIDFWVSSGHHLVDRDDAGRLTVTDDLLKAYLARPEVVPPDDACLVERAVHQRLMRDPRALVETAEVGDIADRDARENWRYLLEFRDHLLRHSTLEAAYLALARAPKVFVPPLFLNQLVHIILRNLLDAERDPFVLRAAEMMFRPQRLTLKDGILLLADAEVVDGANADPHAAPLVAIFGDARAKGLDVLQPDTAEQYYARSDAFDLVVDFRFGQPTRAAFARVLEIWIAGLIGIAVRIEPVERIAEESWQWFVGLDQEATQIGNALWRAEDPPMQGRDRIVALFQLEFVDQNPADAAARGIVEGQNVWVFGPESGSKVRVKALITERVGKGVAWMPFHFGGFFQGEDQRKNYPKGTDPIVLGESVNTVTTYGFDPVTAMHEGKCTLCQIKAA